MIDYRKATEELRQAWFIYKKATPMDTHSVSSFCAGWNARNEEIAELNARIQELTDFPEGHS
jgi:hypothetical protein